MFKKFRSCMVIAAGVILMAMPQVALADDVLVDGDEATDAFDTADGEDREAADSNTTATDSDAPSDFADRADLGAGANSYSVDKKVENNLSDKADDKPYGLSATSGSTSGGDVITLHSPYLSGEVRKSIGNIKDYARGDNHELALLDDGSVVAWGDNTQGQLGYRPDNSHINAQHAVTVKLPKAAIAITAKHNASVALLEDGTVYFWGDGKFEPKQLPLADSRVMSVSIVGEKNATSVIMRTCRSDNCGIDADGVAIWSSLKQQVMTYDYDFGAKVREIAVNPTSHDIAAITRDMLYTWPLGLSPKPLGSKFNLDSKSSGLLHVAAGDINRGQAFLVYDGGALFARDGSAEYSSVVSLPAANNIVQLLNDGWEGYFALNDAGDVFMWYLNGKQWIQIATPEGEHIIKLLALQPNGNKYTAGVVLGLSASGRLYELHTGSEAIPDITPDLTVPTGKNEHLLKKISFAFEGVELDTDKIEYLDDYTVRFSVPPSLHAGVVAVSIEDINGRRWPVGEYNYIKSQVMGGNQLSPSVTPDASGEHSSTTTKPSSTIVKPYDSSKLLLSNKPKPSIDKTKSDDQVKKLKREVSDKIAQFKDRLKQYTTMQKQHDKLVSAQSKMLGGRQSKLAPYGSYGSYSHGKYGAPNTGAEL